MKITTTEKNERTVSYWLNDEITYDKHYVNGSLTSNTLRYHGEKIYGWIVKPIYGFDVNILKKTNPHWGDYQMLEYELPDNPEDVDVEVDINFSQPVSHMFFDAKKEPIPVVVSYDYIHFNDNEYNIDSLESYLAGHDNVIECKKEPIPYYNSDCGNYGLKVLILPEKQWIQHCLNNKILINDMFSLWVVKKMDFLGIKKFLLKT